MNRNKREKTQQHSHCFRPNSPQQLQRARAGGTLSVFKSGKRQKVPNLFWNFQSFSQISILFPGLEIEKTNSILFPDFPYPLRKLSRPFKQKYLRSYGQKNLRNYQTKGNENSLRVPALKAYFIVISDYWFSANTNADHWVTPSGTDWLVGPSGPSKTVSNGPQG